MHLPIIHRLHYTWAGWPMTGRFPDPPGASFFEALDTAWKKDGLSVISKKWTPEQIQLTFRAEPFLSPAFVTARAKGRLDHALRKADLATPFSRRVGFRTLGENTSSVVLNYLANQYDRVELADPRYVEKLRAASWMNPDFDASDPIPTSHGRYWYDLHLVLVTEDRFRIGRTLQPAALRDAVLEWGRTLSIPSSTSRSGQGAPGVKSLAVMHDHLHVVFRGQISRPPRKWRWSFGIA